MHGPTADVEAVDLAVGGGFSGGARGLVVVIVVGALTDGGPETEVFGIPGVTVPGMVEVMFGAGAVDEISAVVQSRSLPK